MFVRACCLMLFCVVVSGCQGPRAALFPWTDDSPTPSLADAELKRALGEPRVNEDAFTDLIASTGADDVVAKATTNRPQDERSKRIESWLMRGQEAIRRSSNSGNPEAMLSEATQSFREVLKLDPGNADAYHGMAIVADLNEDWELADISYKRALASRPHDVDLLNDQGYSYLLQNRFHEASQYLNQVLEISPRHEKAHTNLAILDLRRGNSDLALSRLREVYSEEQAHMALASLEREHGPGHKTSRPGPAMPRELPRSGGGILAAGPRIVPRVQAPSNRTPVQTASQSRQMSQNSTPQQPPLFNASGVIQSPQTAVRPVGAAVSDGHSNTVSQADMQQHAGPGAAASSQSSVVSSARSVGGSFQMPPNINLRRPQLPAGANVYNPDMRPAPSQNQITSANQMVPVNRMAPLQSRSTSLQNGPTQGYPAAAGPAPFSSNQGYSSGPVSGSRSMNGSASYQNAQARQVPPQHTSASGLGFNGAGSGVVSRPAASSSQVGPVMAGAQPHGQLAPDGRPISIYPSSSSLNVRPDQQYGTYPNHNGANPTHGGPYPAQHGQPSGQWGNGATASGLNNSYGPNVSRPVQDTYRSVGMSSAPQSQPAPGTMNPAAWPQSVPGGTVPGTMPQQSTGSSGFHHSGVPQTPVHGPQANSPAPLAPPYFTPPPVMGNGYQNPTAASSGVTAPDVLSEYRAAREQLKNDYDQTLQKIGQPGGRSFQ